MKERQSIISLLSSEDEKSPFKVTTVPSPIVITDSPISPLFHRSNQLVNYEEEECLQSDQLPSPLFHSRCVSKLSMIEFSSSFYQLISQNPKFELKFPASKYSVNGSDELMFIHNEKKIVFLVLPYEVLVKENYPISHQIKPTHIYVLGKGKYLQRISTARQKQFKRMVSCGNQALGEFNESVTKQIDSIEVFETDLLKSQLLISDFPTLFYSEIYPDIFDLVERLIQQEVSESSTNEPKTAPLIRRTNGMKVECGDLEKVWVHWLIEILGVTLPLAEEISRHFPTLLVALKCVEDEGYEGLCNRLTSIVFKGKGVSQKIANRIALMVSSSQGKEQIFHTS